MAVITFLLPLLGQCTAWFMFLSPMPGIVKDRRSGRLSVDPLPFPVILTNSLAWILLAAILEDPWIFTANLVGVLAATYSTATALRFCHDEGVTSRVEVLLVIGMVLIATAVMLISSPVLVKDVEVRKQISGNFCMLIVVLMYGSPCLEAFRAVRYRDASGLSLPLAGMSALNGCLWGCYGAYTGVAALFYPNAFGAFLSLVNIVVKVTVRPQADAQSTAQQRLTKPLLLAMEQEKDVFIRSLPLSCQLNIPLLVESEPDAELEMETVQVCTTEWRGVNTGTALRVLQMSGGNIAFKLSDQRFLCVCLRTETTPGTSSYVPSPFFVGARRCAEVGEDFLFVPVFCDAQSVDPSMAKGALHDYREETVGFWNPLHRVFLRVNDVGAIDCSPPVNPIAGVIAMPAGWEWERFVVDFAAAVPTQIGGRGGA